MVTVPAVCCGVSERWWSALYTARSSAALFVGAALSSSMQLPHRSWSGDTPSAVWAAMTTPHPAFGLAFFSPFSWRVPAPSVKTWVPLSGAAVAGAPRSGRADGRFPASRVRKPGWTHAVVNSSSLPCRRSARCHAVAASITRLRTLAWRRRVGAGVPPSCSRRSLSSTRTRRVLACTTVYTSSWRVFAFGALRRSPRTVCLTEVASSASPVACSQHLKMPLHSGPAVVAQCVPMCSSVSAAAVFPCTAVHALHLRTSPAFRSSFVRAFSPHRWPLRRDFVHARCVAAGSAGCVALFAALAAAALYWAVVYPSYRSGQWAPVFPRCHARGISNSFAVNMRVMCLTVSWSRGMGIGSASVGGARMAIASQGSGLLFVSHPYRYAFGGCDFAVGFPLAVHVRTSHARRWSWLLPLMCSVGVSTAGVTAPVPLSHVCGVMVVKRRPLFSVGGVAL